MGINSGFTLIEILVAVFLMAVGFLALSQMQYLSFRQIIWEVPRPSQTATLFWEEIL
ncbi:MAG: type IV pilus modification PilV family protein [Thermodesulfobacteriota bacterium]